MAEDKIKKTILIIDGNFMSRKLSVDLLELNGFNALSCCDGDSALDTLRVNIPGLILLDINLPGMNGFEVYKKIRENDQLGQIKVIALSASVMKEDEEKIKAAGFDFFIPKPIDLKDFIKKIKEFLPV